MYRLEKMKREKILAGSVALINHEKLGFREYRLFFKLNLMDDESTFINKLVSLPSVITINICGGSYDLIVAFWVKNDREFMENFELIMDNYHHLINYFDIVIGLERSIIGGMKYILNKEELLSISKIRLHKGSTFSKVFEQKKISGEYIVDDTDKKILESMKLSADIPIHELAKQLSLSPFIIKNRIKTMITADIIRNFYPVVHVSKLGYHWWQILIKCAKLNNEKLIAYLRQHRNIRWCIRLLGKWDYQISIYARDNAECHKVIDDLRSTFGENILYYDVLVIFNQLKYAQRVK